MFLEHWARALVLLHTLAAIALVGSATHHALLMRAVFRGRAPNLRLSRVYGPVCAGAYALTLLMGALAYPTYRYYVRGLYLDRWAVWAAQLFELKEDLAVMGLLVAVGVWRLGTSLHPGSDRLQLQIYAVLVWFVPLTVWFATVSGLVITMVRGV